MYVHAHTYMRMRTQPILSSSLYICSSNRCS